MEHVRRRETVVKGPQPERTHANMVVQEVAYNLALLFRLLNLGSTQIQQFIVKADCVSDKAMGQATC